MKTDRNNPSPGREEKHYINEAHEWMDTRLLNGRYPNLYGFLVQVDHEIPAAEIWNRLRFWTSSYLEFKGDRTGHFHRIFDDEIERLAAVDTQEGYSPPFCRRGCSNCCRQPVACTDEEAALIDSYCAKNGIAVDCARLGRQLRFMEFDENGDFTGAPAWDDQPDEDRACVFLDEKDRSCMIWKVRPFVCRNQMAEGTDEFCAPVSGSPNPNAVPVQYAECSYILSAIFTVHHGSVGKTMARLLLGRRGY